jgi:hypothetical protein
MNPSSTEPGAVHRVWSARVAPSVHVLSVNVVPWNTVDTGPGSGIAELPLSRQGLQGLLALVPTVLTMLPVLTAAEDGARTGLIQEATGPPTLPLRHDLGDDRTRNRPGRESSQTIGGCPERSPWCAGPSAAMRPHIRTALAAIRGSVDMP